MLFHNYIFYMVAGIITIMFGVIGFILGKYFSASNIHGMIRLVYDPDDPDHPAMGLMLEDMNYILNHNTIYLGVQKKNFPD